MLPLLFGKKIALGVSSSISVYKAPEIVRLLQKRGASVKVVMSEEAKRFISPLVFEALTKESVLHAQSESWSSGINHIAIASWADLYLIAPATANTINKIAAGIADNLLLSSFLAFDGPKMIAPAANTKMIENPLTQESLRKLEKLRMEIIEPSTKELACGDVGKGALEEPLEIVEQVTRHLLKEPFWENRSVAVSGGGSMEALDEVRFLTNRSSGKMAEALSRALFYRGANVTLFSSLTPSSLPKAIGHIGARSAQDYFDHLYQWQKAHEGQKSTPFLFMAAAIGDYRVATPAKGKLKKEALGERFSLELVQNIDVLQSLIKKGFKTIGFKLEEEGEAAFMNAKKALERKGVEAICLNLIAQESPLESEQNEIWLLTPQKEIKIPRDEKLGVALALLDEVKSL